MSSAEKIRNRAARTAQKGSSLRSMPTERIAEAIGRATADLCSTESAVGRELRTRVPESSGLSGPMVQWAMETAVAPVTSSALIDVAAQATSTPNTIPARARLAVLVLAGNVFTAPLKAVALSLLSKCPVVAKASSRDEVFPGLLKAALASADPELSEAFEVLTYPGGSTRLEDALFSQADVVSVYGSDSTLAEVRARLPATTTFVPHGHGLGAAFVPQSALLSEAGARAVAERLALDVAAYDQRGCLSPHTVWVETTNQVSGREMAQLIAEQLGELSTTLPRGALPTASGAAQVQWRGVATTRGDLFEGDGYATSWEGDGVFRVSPGFRNVQVLSCADVHDLGRRLLPLGAHLKALGVEADPAGRRAVAESLPPPLAPRVSPMGTMQAPPLHSMADGHSPFTGLLRWTQVD